MEKANETLPSCSESRLAELYVAAIPQLRVVAAGLLSRERECSSLQPTLLVSEAWLRLFSRFREFTDSQHVIASAVQVMKRLLIDRARQRRGRFRMTLDAIATTELPGHIQSESSVDVRSAFAELLEQDPPVADTLWLRIVEERTLAEVAQAQQRPLWIVRNDERYGLHWLRQRLGTERWLAGRLARHQR